jgi:hypothetical protein
MTRMNNKTVDTFESIENIQVNFEVGGREVDGWMGGRWVEKYPLTPEPAWDDVLINTSQKDRHTKRAKELKDTSPEELEFW